ncbi:MAG: YdeI/OmpD-associated family protein [Crocinitomicaceae bacterium]|nr:YdeI/OmpD-associated family protein [Crocinitomicaceae bacterium]
MNPKADFYFQKSKRWQNELEKLRLIALDCNLKEDLKWGCPCYTLNNSNVVLIHEFKDYCAFLFFKGALMKDPKGILIQQSKNVQAARQIRFTNVAQITKLQTSLKSYIKQAIEIERAGLKVEMKKTTEFEMPEEFKIVLNKNKKLKSSFESLTPGRQRAYLLFFSSAKQSATRQARIEKHIPSILKGKGLND